MLRWTFSIPLSYSLWTHIDYALLMIKAPTMQTIRSISLAVCLVFVSICASAELRMPSIFGDHMVIQQDQGIQVWGWADSGTNVSVNLSTRSATTQADETGRWSAKLAALKDAGPHTLTVSSNNDSLEFNDVLVGEVWLCSGQSNMEWPVSRANNPEEEIAAAK